MKQCFAHSVSLSLPPLPRCCHVSGDTWWMLSSLFSYFTMSLHLLDWWYSFTFIFQVTFFSTWTLGNEIKCNIWLIDWEVYRGVTGGQWKSLSPEKKHYVCDSQLPSSHFTASCCNLASSKKTFLSPCNKRINKWTQSKSNSLCSANTCYLIREQRNSEHLHLFTC